MLVLYRRCTATTTTPRILLQVIWCISQDRTLSSHLFIVVIFNFNYFNANVNKGSLYFSIKIGP